MTTIEQRKAAAREDLVYSYTRQVKANAHMRISEETYTTLRELLQPASSEQEMDEALATLNHDDIIYDMATGCSDYFVEVCEEHIRTLIRAALKPLREWRTMESVIENARPFDRRNCFADGVEGTAAYEAFGEIICTMDRQPLPEQQKVTK